MSKALYAETIAADPRHRRHEEQVALRRLVGMLDAAEAQGPGSRQAIDAIAAVSSVWSALLEDLVRPENDLPVELRAQIISIGIFLLKEVEAIRSGQSRNFLALREITENIAAGLS
jgi:flagellar biosynthesis activator protein FlaF